MTSIPARSCMCELLPPHYKLDCPKNPLAPALPPPSYETRDSGERAEYSTGMVRDTEEGKARFDLLMPVGIPYEAQMLTRFARLLERGAQKYEARNWEKARTDEELERYRSSAFRHLMQWMAGEIDEDHAAAVMFNLLAAETVRFRMYESY